MEISREKVNKKIKHVLLMWNTKDEDINCYLIPLQEIKKEQRNWLRRCHKNYINSSGTTFNGPFEEEQINYAVMIVHELIADPEAKWLPQNYFKKQAKQFGVSSKEFKSMYGSWKKYQLNLAIPKTIPQCKIVQSGMFP